jgi:hypothetical protein
MKATAEQLATLRTLIAPNDTPERRARYLAGNFPRAEFVHNLDRRYAWDLFYLARVPREVVENLADAHIETALKRIVPPLAA